MLFSDDPNSSWPRDPKENEPEYDPENYPKRYSEGLRSAARALSILCIFTIGFIYLSVPLGALAILFALLSCGAHKLKKAQKSTIRLAVIGMLLSAAVTGYMFYRVYSDPVLYAQMQDMVDYLMRMYNGESPVDALDGPGPAGIPGTAAETEAQGPDLSDPDSILEYYLTPHDENGAPSSGAKDGADASQGQAGQEQPGQDRAEDDAGQDVLPEPFIPDEIAAPSGGDYT